MSTAITLRLIGLVAFCSMASMRICDPMLIDLGREFGVSTGDASRVVSTFAIAYGLMQLIYGPLGDRIGKLRVIVLASFAWRSSEFIKWRDCAMAGLVSRSQGQSLLEFGRPKVSIVRDSIL